MPFSIETEKESNYPSLMLKFYVNKAKLQPQFIKNLLLMACKKKLYGPFLWMGSTVSRLEPLRGGSLRFTTKFPEIPGAH